MRGLFSTKIALRLDEASYVDMTLGEGVRDRGAFADQIPDHMPGVACIKRDGTRESLRVRAGCTSDDDIAELVRFATSTDADILDFPRSASTGVDSTEDAEVVEDYEYIDPDDEVA